ncbi:MAG: polysaccharide deacetylase family protein [Bacteroidales bacterium]|nr:polysaccharide deacetylase family protein [Bacteroidales bacterium]
MEDWYNCDFISEDFNWDKYEVRIYDGVDRVLSELKSRDIKATFFCLGWIAEMHPDIIRRIHSQGHHIGCHSYQHQLSFRFSPEEFRQDTLRAKELIVGIIGSTIDAFRAPGFSITNKNKWAFEILIDLGFNYDCSIFPAAHDYGGFPEYGKSEPSILKLKNGVLKEFPTNTKKILGKDVVFTGGGFFRLFPYPLIKRWSKQSDYIMTYFHPRDFDSNQPVLNNLPIMRKFKSYYGIKGAFSKFQNYLDDFEFVSVIEADKQINWENLPIMNLK